MDSNSNETPNEILLNDCPDDLISAVKFGPASNQFLLTSSWDCNIRLYDVSNNAMRVKVPHPAPVLDCCFEDNVHAWSGGLDLQVRYIDLNTSVANIMGAHDSPVKCVEYCPDLNVVITGSWDKTLKLWDVRAPQSADTYFVPDKVYTMAVCEDNLVIGLAGRKVMVYNLRNMSYVQQKRESSLKYQTRCIRCFPNKQGFVLSSIEGRAAVEYFDPSSDVQRQKYAFKCHRIKDPDGIELIYPVNAIAFHNRYNTFATGGSDGYVNIWDGFNKKRLCQFRRYPSHVSSLAFSPDGTTMAIASSFIYDETTPKEAKDEIFIRTVTDHETKPKLSSDQ